jgi:uncharacterized protein YjdB
MASTRGVLIAVVVVVALASAGCGRRERLMVSDAQASDGGTIDDMASPDGALPPSALLISPTKSTLAPGGKQQLDAFYGYAKVTKHASWSSNKPLVASVDASGKVTALARGQATITAVYKAVKGVANVEVDDWINSLVVVPANPTIAVGTTQQFMVTAVYMSGKVSIVTSQVTWSSSNPAVASFIGGGLVVVGPGTTTITATLKEGGKTYSGNTVLTVIKPPIVSIAVTPATASTLVGGTVQYKATGCAPVTWSSSNPVVATVSSTGLATGTSGGSATIAATCKGGSGKAVLTVVGGLVCKILTITPSSPQTIGMGQTIPFTAVCSDNFSITHNVSNKVTWNASPTGIVTFSGNQAKGIKNGSTQVTATYANPAGLIPASVTSSTVLVSISGTTPIKLVVSPSSATVKVGFTQQFIATVIWNTGTSSNETKNVSWQSSAVSTAVISGASGTEGLATGVSTGVASITATLTGLGGPLTDSATFTVVP